MNALPAALFWAGVTALATTAPARADTYPSGWNASPDPTSLYGGCLPGNSAPASKLNTLAQVGFGPSNLLAVRVL